MCGSDPIHNGRTTIGGGQKARVTHADEPCVPLPEKPRLGRTGSPFVSAPERPSSRSPLATVTDLTRPAPDVASTDSTDRELAAHARFLHGRYGDRWIELPEALGRPLVHAQALMASGPVSIPATTPAMQAIVRARRAARAATAMGKIAHNEGEILEQALGVRLADLPMERLSAVVDSVLGLSTAPRAEPTWASPLAARAAEALLDACCDDLREGARTHQAVYAQFTDRIWDVPVRRLHNGRRPWRLIARFRLRRALAASSRTEQAPTPVAVAADLVLAARAVRDRLLPITPLLANHFGEHDRGPVTNVDAARESLTAVRHLHSALGERLNDERLARLLAADAFKNDAVLEPVRILSNALRRWSADVVKLGGPHEVPMGGAELVQWASLIEEALPVVEGAVTAAAAAGGSPSTLRDLVYDLLVRERFNELTTGPSTTAAAANTAGRAS